LEISVACRTCLHNKANIDSLKYRLILAYCPCFAAVRNNLFWMVP